MHVLTKIFIVLVSLLAVLLVPLVVVFAHNEDSYKEKYQAATVQAAAANQNFQRGQLSHTQREADLDLQIRDLMSENDALALAVDVIAPEGYGEIIGGSQRIHDHDLLLQRIREHGLPEEAFRWYLDIRRYGTVPHGGFGMGIERFVTWVCGIEHLRQAIPYPRQIHRIYP